MSKESKHTQGEWKVVEVKVDDKPLYFIEDEENETVCDLYHKNNNDDFFSHKQEEAKANAHLMASAPELLEALKEALDTLTEVLCLDSEGKDMDGNDYRAWFKLTEAINKAEGGTEG